MNEQLYRLLFKGETIPGIDLNMVKQNVAKLYKVDLAKAEKLFTGKTFVLKNGINLAAAQKFMFDFENAGAICEIEKIAMESPKPERVMESQPEKPAVGETRSQWSSESDHSAKPERDKAVPGEAVSTSPHGVMDMGEREEDEPMSLSLDIKIPSEEAFVPEIPESSMQVDRYDSPEPLSQSVQISLDIPEASPPQEIRKSENESILPEEPEKALDSKPSASSIKPFKRRKTEKTIVPKGPIENTEKPSAQYGFRKVNKSNSFNKLFIIIPVGVIVIAVGVYLAITFLGSGNSDVDSANTGSAVQVDSRPLVQKRAQVESPDLSEETTESFTDPENLFSVTLPSGFKEDHRESVQAEFLSQYRFLYMKKSGNSEKASVIIRISKEPQEFTIITAQNNKEKEILANQDVYLSGCQAVKSESNPISGFMGYRIFLESNDNSGRIARFYEFASNRNTVFSIWIVSYTRKNVEMLSRAVEESLMVN